jgi:hypothetical protein
MISNLISSLIFNEIEYYIYINILILSLFIFYGILFFIILNSTLLFNSIYSTDIYIETIISLISFIYIIFIIAPGLLLFIDLDSISSFNFLIYILGYQWA